MKVYNDSKVYKKSETCMLSIYPLSKSRRMHTYIQMWHTYSRVLSVSHMICPSLVHLTYDKLYMCHMWHAQVLFVSHVTYPSLIYVTCDIPKVKQYFCHMWHIQNLIYVTCDIPKVKQYSCHMWHTQVMFISNIKVLFTSCITIPVM